MIGGGGNDLLFGGSNVDYLLGGNGADQLYGWLGDDLLFGGDLIAELSLEDEGDELHGMQGDDTLYGQRGGDFLDGGTGWDLIDGGEGDNTHLALWATGIVPEGPYYTVTVDHTLDDDEPGSLRWSLGFAEALDPTMRAVVDFQIPNDDPRYVDIDETFGGDSDPDVFRLQAADELPPLLRGNVVINGLSQGAFAELVLLESEEPNPAGPEIILDGSYVLTHGVDIRSDRNGVFGLGIRQFQQNGILILGDENTVGSNFIGTDPTGNIGLANLGIGVLVFNGAGNHIVTNLISGNAVNGVVLSGTGAQNNVIWGNRIGTNADGTAAIGNTFGIHLFDAPNNLVEQNLISGNEFGLVVGQPNASDNIIRGNVIGLMADRSTPLGNDQGGLSINGAPSNLITENDIAANGTHGIGIQGDGATGNWIHANSIHSNAGLGIDLAPTGVTANDPLDADVGPNRRQNYPVILFASAGEQTQVVGTLHSTPLATFELEFFANSSTDSSGFGEGERYLGSASVTTDAAGDGVFDATLLQETLATEWITATATNTLLRDTSEFSQAYLAIDAAENVSGYQHQR